jgi:hypothetical protein
METAQFPSCVAYYRVSTEKQGASGLGLEAQRIAVRAHLDKTNRKLVGELVEIESGKNPDRPKLAEALKLCRLSTPRTSDQGDALRQINCNAPYSTPPWRSAGDLPVLKRPRSLHCCRGQIPAKTLPPIAATKQLHPLACAEALPISIYILFFDINFENHLNQR